MDTILEKNGPVRLFENIVHGLRDGVVALDRQWRYAFVNDRALSILKKRRDELVGRVIWEVYPDIAGTHFEKIYGRVMRERDPAAIDSFYAPLGVWLRIFVYPVEVGIALQFTDITGQKKVEAELARSRENAETRAGEAEDSRRILYAIMQCIREGITVADAPDGRIRMVSSFGGELLGRPEKEIVEATSETRPEKWGFYENDGKTPAKPDALPLTRSIKKGEIVQGEEWLVKRPDGELRTFSFSSAPILDEKDVIVGAVSGWRDITDLKKAGETLRRNEFELRVLADNTPDLIFRFNRRLQYVYANPAYERLTGIARDGLIGKTNKELGMSRKTEGLWQDAVEEAFESERVRSVEFETSGFFGKRYFSARVTPEFNKAGQVETVLVVARDITGQKHCEEEIAALKR